MRLEYINNLNIVNQMLVSLVHMPSLYLNRLLVMSNVVHYYNKLLLACDVQNFVNFGVFQQFYAMQKICQLNVFIVSLFGEAIKLV